MTTPTKDCKCECVTRHTPTYLELMGFNLPSGTVVWLCPNTFYQAETLLSRYYRFEGKPRGEEYGRYTVYVRNLVSLYWDQLPDSRKK